MPDGNFDMNDLKQSVEEIQGAFNEIKASVSDQKLEEKMKGAADPLIEEKLTRVNKFIDKHEEKLEQYYLSQEALARQLDAVEDSKGESKEELDRKAFMWASDNLRKRNKSIDNYTHEEMKSYEKAFEKMLREGKEELSADEVKALSVGSDADGGFVVTPDTSGRMVKRSYETSAMRTVANVKLIGTDSLEGLYDLGEVASGWVSETGSRSETATSELGMWTIPTHEQYAFPFATQKILDDAYLNMEEWVINKGIDKMSRTENAAFVNGDGAGKPRGFMTYDAWTTPGTPEQNALEEFETGAAGDFAGTDPGNVLLDMIYGLKEVYRPNARFYMNRASQGEVRKLTDNDGKYLWEPSWTVGQPSRLMGYPTVSFEDMADFADDAKPIAFGDMNQAYQVVERMGTRILRDPFTNKPFIGFYMTRRVGGAVIDFEALKILKLAD